MPIGRVTFIAAAVAMVLWLMLDSGLIRGEHAPTTTSLSLGILAAIFALGGWGTWVVGQRTRSPLLVGFAAGAGVYALVRLVAY
jgi:hypothetical protein